MTTYTELFGDVRSTLRLSDAVVTDADLLTQLKIVNDEFNNLKLESTLARFALPEFGDFSNLRSADYGVYGGNLDTLNIQFVRDVYDADGNEVDSADTRDFTERETPASDEATYANDYNHFVVIGREIRVYLTDTTQPAPYLYGYTKLPTSGLSVSDGADNPLLQASFKLYHNALLHRVLIWQRAEAERIAIALGEYREALDSAIKQSFLVSIDRS